jgi:ketosteroid isomerase-like protein
MALVTLDRQELDRFARAFEELFYQGDAATMAAFYAEDAEVMAPDTEVVRGQHAIEEFFKAASAAAQRMGMRRSIHVRQVERSGDLGYVLSTVVLELPAADGQTIPRSTTSRSGSWTPIKAGGFWWTAPTGPPRRSPHRHDPRVDRGLGRTIGSLGGEEPGGGGSPTGACCRLAGATPVAAASARRRAQRLRQHAGAGGSLPRRRLAAAGPGRTVSVSAWPPSSPSLLLDACSCGDVGGPSAPPPRRCPGADRPRRGLVARSPGSRAGRVDGRERHRGPQALRTRRLPARPNAVWFAALTW